LDDPARQACKFAQHGRCVPRDYRNEHDPGWAGARGWSERLKTEPASQEGDPCIPADWKAAWDWAALLAYLDHIGACNDLSELHRERLATEEELRSSFAKLVKERTFFNLAASMKGTAKAALNAFAQLIRRIGKGQAKVRCFIVTTHG